MPRCRDEFTQLYFRARFVSPRLAGAMSHFELFLALWPLTLLASEHLLAARDIALGDGLPDAPAMFVRIAFVLATAGIAFLFLLLAAEMAVAP